MCMFIHGETERHSCQIDDLADLPPETEKEIHLHRQTQTDKEASPIALILFIFPSIEPHLTELRVYQFYSTHILSTGLWAPCHQLKLLLLALPFITWPISSLSSGLAQRSSHQRVTPKSK